MYSLFSGMNLQFNYIAKQSMFMGISHKNVDVMDDMNDMIAITNITTKPNPFLHIIVCFEIQTILVMGDIFKSQHFL